MTHLISALATIAGVFAIETLASWAAVSAARNRKVFTPPENLFYRWFCLPALEMFARLENDNYAKP